MKVNTKTFFVTDSEKKKKLQDHLDSVLKISYPYISEAKNLTSMKSKILKTDNQIKIKVIPDLLPVGEEDYSVLIIGVRSYEEDGNNSLVKIKILRKDTEN